MPFVHVARQDLSTAVVTIDQNAQDPATTALKFDDGADDAQQTGSPSLTATLEGTLELSDLTMTRTPSPSSTENVESNASEPGSAGKKQDIPMAAVIIACVVVAVLCCALAALLWWKRKRDKKARRREREHRMSKHRQNRIGGHGHSQDKDGPWEEFKDPPALHSPGSFYSADAHQPSQPNYQHRMSVKSTVTGKVNPSNNFAFDDEDDEDDGRSMRSRGMLSPGSGKVHFHDSHPASRVAGGDPPESFLSFRSGIDANHQFPPQPIHREGPLREGPAKVVTHSPKRSNTHKSHKGQHGVDKKAKQNNMIALSNLIAALDSQDTSTRRRSFESLHSTEANSPHPANPFQDPSFVQNLRNALPPPSPSPAR